HARAVFEEESSEAARPYAREGGPLAAVSFYQRWYDSTTGRFLSRDSVGAGSYLATPNGLGVWGYANGNPARFTDPDGRFTYDEAGNLSLETPSFASVYGFGSPNPETTEHLELLVAFMLTKDSEGGRLGFTAHYNRFASQLAAGDHDPATYRVHLVSLIQTYWSDPGTRQAREDADAELRALMMNLNGLTGAKESAEAALLAAGLLGAYTSAEDIFIPVAGVVVKASGRGIWRVLRAALGRNRDAAADLLLREAGEGVNGLTLIGDARLAKSGAEGKSIADASWQESFELSSRSSKGVLPPIQNAPAVGALVKELYGTTAIPSGTNLAFGFARHLDDFEKSQGAVSVFSAWELGYHQLPVGQLSVLKGNFSNIVNAFVGNGGRIKFDLTGLKPGIEGATSWELRQILGNPQWEVAADFFRNGEQVTGTALEEALKPWR
ncbi:MAG: hypothetical protein AB1725_12420, partial [Armatimonadota bacterium]